MQDEERSRAIARVAGWNVQVHSGFIEIPGTFDGDPKLFTYDFYSLDSVEAAWRVLNWGFAYLSEKSTDSGYVDFSSQLMRSYGTQPLAEAMRTWLDKIWGLAVGATAQASNA